MLGHGGLPEGEEVQRTITQGPPGTAASTQVFGPLLLTGGMAEEPQESRDFRIWRPKELELGIAIALDEEAYDGRRAK